MYLDADFETWSKNESAIQQRFCATLSKTFELPADSIRITRVEQGSTILHIIVRPPHGEVIIKKLSSTDSISYKNNDLIEECGKRCDCRIYSIVLGKFGLSVEERVMDPRWNKVYTHSYGQSDGTFWTGSLDRGGKPYFCPKGNR
jgi:hypothetical protein